MAKQNYVGCARTKPLLQDLMKSSAGGMAAASGGVLALWFNSDNTASGYVLIALALTALSIPLLVASRYIANIFDGFELITQKAEANLDALITGGLGAALGGYFLLIHALSVIASYAFLGGVLIAGYCVRVISKEMDEPSMQRKEL